MKTVFFGTPEWAVPSLGALIASDIEVAAVVTNPDKPAGRGMEVMASPVKRFAADNEIEILQPLKARDPDFKEKIATLGPDVATVVAYGKILPADLLEVPRLGFVNVHFSVLPEYRGAAPVQRAIIDGHDTSGVSIMVLTEGMDEGPVLAIEEVTIDRADTAGTLGSKLATIGADLLIPTLEGYADGSIKPIEQEHSRATYAPKLSNEDSRIDWTHPTEVVRNLVRGLTPVPGAWSELNGKRLKVFAVEPASSDDMAPGEIVGGADLRVGTGDGSVTLDEVQLEGKRKMSGAELARGLRLEPGATLK